MLPIVKNYEFRFEGLGALLEECMCAFATRDTRMPDFQYMEVWVMENMMCVNLGLCSFKCSIDCELPRLSSSIFIRESGTTLIRYCSGKKVELIWFDKNEDKFDNDVVCSRYMLEGLYYADDRIEYVESLLCLPDIFDQQAPPAEIRVSHLTTLQQITVQNINSMVPMKITGANFTIWKSLFLQVLKKYRVEGLVDGTDIWLPAFLSDDNGKITNHVNPAFEKWMDRDKSVRAWLNSRISEDLLPYTVALFLSRTVDDPGEVVCWCFLLSL